MTEPAARPDRTGGTPSWVKVFGILAFVVALLVVVLLVAGGGGGHGPGRHMGGVGDHRPAPGAGDVARQP